MGGSEGRGIRGGEMLKGQPNCGEEEYVGVRWLRELCAWRYGGRGTVKVMAMIMKLCGGGIPCG